MSDVSGKKRVLLTAAPEDVEDIADAGDAAFRWVHLPLEQYRVIDKEVNEAELAGRIEAADTIVYGHKRNARFLIRKMNGQGTPDLLKGRVNLAADEPTAAFLEEHGVPAIYPGSDEPIKMVEFLMRLRRLDSILYPCGDRTREEIPGLLKELDIGVDEQVLYRLEGPTDEELATYRQQVMEHHLDAVVYHSRRSVTRTQAAFPNLNVDKAAIVAGDRGVAEKLAGSGMEATMVAEGSWQSILAQLKRL